MRTPPPAGSLDDMDPQARMSAADVLARRVSRHDPRVPWPRGLRQVILIHGADDYWISECPSLPGCVSEGPTREAAIDGARRAIDAHLAALREAGRPAPPERFETVLLAL